MREKKTWNVSQYFFYVHTLGNLDVCFKWDVILFTVGSFTSGLLQKMSRKYF